jgi:hypothetical protein
MHGGRPVHQRLGSDGVAGGTLERDVLETGERSNAARASDPALDGVSCTGGGCEAVGNDIAGGESTAFAEGWNGSTWSVQSLVQPSGEALSILADVSCATTSCVAVGWYETGAGAFPLSEIWNGSTWNPKSVKLPADAGSGSPAVLSGVSCNPDGTCEAAGYYKTSTNTQYGLAEGWTGKAWQPQVDAAIRPGSWQDVSCVSDTDCEAVGEFGAVVWDGTKWAAQTVATPAGTSPDLDGLSCVTGSCQAVGYYTNASDEVVELAEGWNGSAWKLEHVPAAAATPARLTGAACSSAAICAATGFYGSGPKPIVLSWNGTSWKK